MGHHSYEESKKLVFKGMWILAIITLIEVGVSLFGKGHLGTNPSLWNTSINLPFIGEFNIILFLIGFALVALSIYKAYYIVYKFMHMEYEAKDLARTVLLPTLLLVWAIIAFFQEGDSWGDRREQIRQFDKEEVDMEDTGSHFKQEETKILDI